ncbi:MAG TPA: sulfurtransferase complex subunit TusB [Pseudomonadales bacterium]|nr:sulfurtransferase complex subunit TusB [Pseudomonadales bacterium]
MTILHILSKNLRSTDALQEHIKSMGPGHELLINANGVYMLYPGSTSHALLNQAALQHGLYVLKEDLITRGLSPEALDPMLQQIDYAAFVDLVAKHQGNYRWHEF